MSQPAKSSAATWTPFQFATDLWRHRELLWQFILRNVELRHRGSHLGLIWSVLNPLLTLALYVFVFGYVFRGGFHVLPNESRLDYALGIFLGLSIFHLLAEVLALAPLTIIGNPNFVKKVVFPLEILPAANVGSSLIHFIISLGLVLFGVIFLGAGITWKILWLPVILVFLVLLSLGVAWFFSALGVFFRDIAQIVTFFSMALMFASAIFYPASSVPPAAWRFLRFNPVLLAVEQARDAVMWDRPANPNHLIYLGVVSLAAAIGGYWCFRKMSPAFADVV